MVAQGRSSALPRGDPPADHRGWRRQQRLVGAAVETRTPESGQRARPRHRGQPPAAWHQQVEQNRAPPLLFHQPELARQAPRQLSGHRRADLGHHHQNRSHRALRTRHRTIPQRDCRIRRRDGRHQHQTCRLPRRVELHHLTKYSSSKLRVYFMTYPKLRWSAIAIGFQVPITSAPGYTTVYSPTNEPSRKYPAWLASTPDRAHKRALDRNIRNSIS